MRPVARPGSVLRQYRRENGWTLAFVSERTSIPISTLSRIENDQISPTFGQLSKLSTGLSIDIASLLSTSPQIKKAESGPSDGAYRGSRNSQRRSVNRLGEGEMIDFPGMLHYYLNADLLEKQFTPIIVEIKTKAIGEIGEFLRHPGEEYAFVIEGTLELHTEIYAPLVLKAGESVYFDSSMPHAYVSKGKKTCRVLSICTAPQYEKEPARNGDPGTPGAAKDERPSRAKARVATKSQAPQRL